MRPLLSRSASLTRSYTALNFGLTAASVVARTKLRAAFAPISFRFVILSEMMSFSFSSQFPMSPESSFITLPTVEELSTERGLTIADTADCAGDCGAGRFATSENCFACSRKSGERFASRMAR